MDTAILSMIPESDYLFEQITFDKQTTTTEQQFFGSGHLKNPGKAEDHTPIQTRNLHELRELQEKEKLNTKDDVE